MILIRRRRSRLPGPAQRKAAAVKILGASAGMKVGTADKCNRPIARPGQPAAGVNAPGRQRETDHQVVGSNGFASAGRAHLRE